MCVCASMAPAAVIVAVGLASPCQEVRHILNIATINAVAPIIKMVTLDADDTIYEHGGA